MRKRLAIALGAVAALAALAAPVAQADHHLVKIREVHNGGGTHAGDYVVLQMYAQGENLFTDHYLSIRGADGQPSGDHHILFNGAGTANQSTFLIGNLGVATADDNSIGDVGLDGSGGAACYEETNALVGGIDCVSWGNFTGSVTPLSSPAGSNAPAIPDGLSLVRSIAPGCPTLLEASDDTNDSAADFALGAGSARNSHSVPTETPCGAGATTPPITNKTKCKKKKKKKGKKKSAGTAKKKKKKCKKKRKHHKKH